MAHQYTTAELDHLLDTDPNAYYRVRAASVVTAAEGCATGGHRYGPDDKCINCPARKTTRSYATLGALDTMESDSRHCPHWTLDLGCPLHGETC